MNERVLFAAAVSVLLGLGIACLFAVTAGYRRYDVWAQEQAGRAELAKAEWTRKIATLEATAKKESARELAAAEVERAKGVAEANRIIGESLRGHDEYLRYLWIVGLEAGAGRETVYVPTEAGLPILEANRLQVRP